MPDYPVRAFQLARKYLPADLPAASLSRLPRVFYLLSCQLFLFPVDSYPHLLKTTVCNTSRLSVRFMFTIAVSTFRSAEYTFRSGEPTFRSAEYKTYRYCGNMSMQFNYLC